MTESTHARVRILLLAVLALSAFVFTLQATVVRPFVWPAGSGVAMTADSVVMPLAAPSAVPRLRPPHIARTSAIAFETAEVRPGSMADVEGLRRGSRIERVTANGVTLVEPREGDPLHALTVWRDAYWLGMRGPVTLTTMGAAGRRVTLSREPIWSLDYATQTAWLRTHGGALLQIAAFLAGAIALVALGTRGTTASLMTLALLLTATANAGPLLGAERTLPIVRELLVVFCWLATPLAFPVIGYAVLHFPSRAAVLDRHRWIAPGIAAAALPILVINLAAALYLIGWDAIAPLLAWLAAHAWTFDVSFGIALVVNVAIVIEGVGRYRRNPDITERRRIQIIVYTGVPAVFAFALRAAVPLIATVAGRPIELHWLLDSALQLVVLLPAVGLPYAVAVRQVFSPRTVLRRSLQYALARRTLSTLVVLPIVAFLVTLVVERERPLGEIVLGQPLFFAVCLVLAAAGLRYREPAQHWLDQKFFRDEYDAREILVSLASRVPYETDPRELVALVLTQIDSALHPEGAAVLAGDGELLDVIGALRANVTALRSDGPIVTLLRWSDQPLDVMLDDERSPAARLPQADRAWLAESGVHLLVPIYTRSGESGRVVGAIALGRKQSEEPYTAEDRRLLSGISAQMSVALDLSRLRRATPTALLSRAEASATVAGATAATTIAPLMTCPACLRCYPAGAVGGRCPDDDQPLHVVVGMPPVVDGKYRVDAVIGRGGMGAVFRARDLRLDRDVAIKIVRADLVANPESRARFRREAQIVARLQHPAIVTVFDYGNLPDGAAFLVMEYVRGEDLRHVLKRERTLSIGRTSELMAGVALGVEAAHRAGVLHRDLKPENILLPSAGGGPKVLDFGVAKLTDTTEGTITGGATIVGTPAYMAPEQLRGSSVDARADVYSLAVITYELLTGQLPFGSGSFIDIGIRQSLGAGAIDTSRLPASLASTLLAAMALDPDGRPASPAAFAEALRAGT